MTKKTALIILDGWGIAKDKTRSAIDLANTPFVDSLYKKYSHDTLTTFGQQVGLPEGQMGNSEVGHLNIGAGRIVFQALARINNALEDGTLDVNPKFKKLIEYSKSKDKPIHLMGLLSDGGVHSHIEHLKSLIGLLKKNTNQPIYIHAFLDGRDTGPNKGIEYIDDLNNYLDDQVQLSSVIGRYYAMDRDNRWERIKLAYDLMVLGKGSYEKDIKAAIQKAYDKGLTDEFMDPIKVTSRGNINSDDAVLFFNFRTDRPRQLTIALTQKDFPEFEMKKVPTAFFTMTNYSESFKDVHVLFAKEEMMNTLGEVLEKENKTQLRIAETEKYPHVTFFFSGGREEPFIGESRILINSPKVATYDLQPQMSAHEVTAAVVKDIDVNAPDFICLNFANVDMVGHTGDMNAAITAVETVDACLNKVVSKALNHHYTCLVIADHGNADIMKNEDGSVHTAHTTNLVPMFLVSKDAQLAIRGGKLGDVAPTILELMGLSKPKEMGGESLLIS